jgi:two-component system cell cycle response regulator
MPANILLIEDNRDHLELMAYLLRAFGHKPLSVSSGEAGLGVAENFKIDLVVCDLVLPHMSGFEVARNFKDCHSLKDIPLVAITAGSSDSARQRALAAGFDSFMAKPISPETFSAEISRFLRPGTTEPQPNSRPGADRPEVESQPSKLRQRTGKILAVDDRLTNLDLARCTLEPCGYTVTTAGGVREALELIRRDPPDLVLTDVHMGDGTGFDLIRAIRQDGKLQDVLCMAISATYLEADPRVEELGLDASTFILRPIEPESLIAKVDACLLGRRTGPG